MTTITKEQSERGKWYPADEVLPELGVYVLTYWHGFHVIAELHAPDAPKKWQKKPNKMYWSSFDGETEAIDSGAVEFFQYLTEP